MTTLTYALLVEIEPGVLRPAILCTPDDLAHARALEALRATIRQELAELIAAAIRYDVELSLELRERVALWAGGVEDGERLAEELRAALSTHD